MVTDIKIGDLITAYHAGFHRVIGFHTLKYTKQHLIQQVEYKTVLTSQGKPCNKKARSCHIDFCKVVDEAAVRVIYRKELDAVYDKFEALMKELGVII